VSNLYIGLMSGTSMDGIDAALVRFSDSGLDILQTLQQDYPEDLRRRLIVSRSDTSLRSCDDVPDLHAEVGLCFRDAANALLALAKINPSAITAIGSHGQTLRHAPGSAEPFSLQIGDANLIAKGTGITTIADFRRADIELGGQGAPLAPAFHEWLFRNEEMTHVVLNIGGIANITVLHADDLETTGFDTGPGNTLLDAWALKHLHTPYDANGDWSASGSVASDLLSRLTSDAYFAATAPKSTGFEYFNLDWLDEEIASQYDPADVQATLCQLTADSIAEAIRTAAPDANEVLVCGGGVHNHDLMRRLEATLPGTGIASTAIAGLDPDWVEAAAFAWLAMRTTQGQTGNLPSVTGADRSTVLGVTHTAS
jgi:anhydro-N-acetylmuramic acid kinase